MRGETRTITNLAWKKTERGDLTERTLESYIRDCSVLDVTPEAALQAPGVGALSAHAVIRRGSERRPASPLFLDNVFALALGVSRLIAPPDCGQLKALTDDCERRAEKASHKTLARSSASGELVRHEPAYR